jgi:hypothetical protein
MKGRKGMAKQSGFLKKIEDAYYRGYREGLDAGRTVERAAFLILLNQEHGFGGERLSKLEQEADKMYALVVEDGEYMADRMEKAITQIAENYEKYKQRKGAKENDNGQREQTGILNWCGEGHPRG